MSWTDETKHSSTLTSQSKKSGRYFLLQENAFYLLQENGFRILLQSSMSWLNNSKNTSVQTNQTKNNLHKMLLKR